MTKRLPDQTDATDQDRTAASLEQTRVDLSKDDDEVEPVTAFPVEGIGASAGGMDSADLR